MTEWDKMEKDWPNNQCPSQAEDETNLLDKDLLEQLFEDGELGGFIANNICDPWVDSQYKGYVYMSPKQKGEFGEIFTEKLLKNQGFSVKAAETSTSGYDRWVNEKKCEIKFSLATRNNKNKGNINKDSFIINHVSKDKDWDFLLFIGINPEPKDIRIIWFKKEDFREHYSTCFNVQQGGKKIDNDDYMCTRIDELTNCEWVHEGINSLKEIMFIQSQIDVHYTI